MKIYGYYLDGKTSRRTPCHLEVYEGSPELAILWIDSEDLNDEERKKTIRASEVQISSQLGNTPREIAFGDDELFVTEDNSGINEWQSLFPSSGSDLMHRLENNIALILIALVCSIGLVWGVIGYGIPASAKYIAHELPDFAADQFGSSLTVLDETIFSPSQLDSEEQERVRSFLQPYIDSYPQIGMELNFRSGMGANAFALPDNQIVLTDDFVKLAEKDEEIIAVFLHEVGHLHHKHILRRVLQDSMITLLVIMVTGDLDSVDLITGLPTLLMDLSYSRKFEFEADLFAYKEMKKHGISRKHFANIIQRIAPIDKSDSKSEEVKTVISYLSTHPATEMRVKLANEHDSQE